MTFTMSLPETMGYKNKFYYIVKKNYFPSSVSPLYSDSFSNLLVLDQVVGTLLKYGGSGRHEPFLVKSWNRKENGRMWIFTFKQNLYDELGTPINPDTYRQGLINVLNLLKKKNNKVPPFTELKGWSNFIETNDSSLLGISINNDQLFFHFNSEPYGLLEYLSMPYFGYYNINDFTKNGDWVSDYKITSSSAYRIQKFNKDEIILQKRDWFSHIKGSADFVTIKHEIPSDTTSKIILTYDPDSNEKIKEGFKLVRSTPTILNAFVISPFKEGLFENKINRQIFQQRYLKFIQEQSLPFFPFSFSKFFYPLINNSPSYIDISDSNFHYNKVDEIKILMPSFFSKQKINFLKNLLNSLLPEFKQQLRYDFSNRSDKDWILKSRHNYQYDISFRGVDVGASPENWSNEMMFCTDLGISFPDPDGHICNLVSEYQSKSEIDQAYIDKFNFIIQDQASVIPLWHSGQAWQFSNNIDTSAFSTTMSLPRFDLLR